MLILFLVVGGLGAAVLIVQIALSLFGLDHELPGDADLSAALDLLSVRALSAGAATFGIGGLAGLQLGLPSFFALVLGVLGGVAMSVVTAWLTRQLLGLESSGSLDLQNAIGSAGMVHLSVPAARLHKAGASAPARVHTVPPARQRPGSVVCQRNRGAKPHTTAVPVLATAARDIALAAGNLCDVQGN